MPRSNRDDGNTMGPLAGELLPLSIAIAISPLAIVAAVLLLLSPRAKATGPAFLLGWLGGLVLVIGVATLLAGFIPEQEDAQSRPIAGVLFLVLGLALIVLAVRQFAGRPKAGQTPAAPKWMAGIASMKASRAAVLGFLFAAVSPKNLVLGIAVGIAIGSAGVPAATAVVAIIATVLLASLAVAIPVVGYLVAPKAMAAPLEGLRSWLMTHNSAVMIVLFVVIGFQLVGEGIAAF